MGPPAPASEPGAPADGTVAQQAPSSQGVPESRSCGQVVLHPSREEYPGLLGTLHDDGFVLCVDLTAADYLTAPDRVVAAGVETERFELVLNLVDPEQRRRVRLRVQVPGDDPVVPTAVDMHPGVEAMEREVFDMFGITFAGHPDPTRILMPDDWDGHPLRKDYALGRIPVQFKAAEGR